MRSSGNVVSRCPWLRSLNQRPRGNGTSLVLAQSSPVNSGAGAGADAEINKALALTVPPIMPGYTKEMRNADLLYVSHSDPTERQARILRVQQSIKEKSG
ncbi:unnamed protein product [Arabis nemorensis]|uniref:Uncharacterized protein n=1 Tax=Arabis nemorensis TaxID=586526 RepID=A0A565BI45_9BRAS|nr:unnamed protein product [Arabis nemorensis]